MPNIKYHPDVRGYAVNVKTYGMRFAEGGTELQREFAWDSTHEDWWNVANEIAKQEGFSGAGSCGRLNGWCAPYDINKAVPESRSDHYVYVEDENDPRLAKFAERIEELLEEAPAMYKQTLDRIIKEDEETQTELEFKRDQTLALLEDSHSALGPELAAYWREQWRIK